MFSLLSHPILFRMLERQNFGKSSSKALSQFSKRKKNGKKELHEKIPAVFMSRIGKREKEIR
jgi:hypothetical protein